MGEDIYLRLLKESDASILCRWRNNPNIWKYTDSDLSQFNLTETTERLWIQRVNAETNSVRFAICLMKNRQFVGIVDLRDIDVDSSSASFNIFIGEESCWGQGIGSQATRKTLSYAKEKLSLKRVVLWVAEENVAAVKVYLKIGFRFLEERELKRWHSRKMEILLDVVE